jgi:phosphatidylglycerophosphatase A
MPFKDTLIYGFASGFGSGYLPKAPGTWGSVVGFCITLAFGLLQESITYLWILAVFLGILGYFSSKYIIYNDTNIKDFDPSFIVIDEIVGIMVAAGTVGIFRPYTIIDLAVIFVLFRMFDIFKPGPIGYVDRKLCETQQTAALGIMLDDVLAGLIAGLVFLLAF